MAGRAPSAARPCRSPQTSARAGPADASATTHRARVRAHFTTAPPRLAAALDVRARDVRRRAAADELERRLDLRAEEFEHAPRAGLAVDDEAPERRAPGEHGARAEGERLHDVRPAPDPAVEQHLDPAADGLDDLGEGVDRGGDAVELPPAV